MGRVLPMLRPVADRQEVPEQRRRLNQAQVRAKGWPFIARLSRCRILVFVVFTFGCVAMPTTIRLSPEIEARLDRLARSTGRPKSYYLREAIYEALPRMEETYRIAALVERVHSGDEPIFDLQDVVTDLGLDD